MQYEQMTLEGWAEMKQNLRKEILHAQEKIIEARRSFIRIGFALRQIDDGRLYEKDGYKSVAEFAREEYGLGPSAVTRFMAVNREFSVGGYSEQIAPEYEELKKYQLEAMLSLPREDRQMVKPEASRESIRELSRFNKENENSPDNLTAWRREPEDGLRKTVESFYHDNPDLLRRLRESEAYWAGNVKEFAELVNPSGNRSYRKGTVFLMMYGIDRGIMVKDFRNGTQTITWESFLEITGEVFERLEGHGSEPPAAAQDTMKDSRQQEDPETPQVPINAVTEAFCPGQDGPETGQNARQAGQAGKTPEIGRQNGPEKIPEKPASTVKIQKETDSRRHSGKPEIFHFTARGEAYGYMIAQIVKKYLESGSLGQEEAWIEIFNQQYIAVARDGITSFYRKDGSTFFEVENARLEAEYARMREDRTAGGTEKAQQEAGEAPGPEMQEEREAEGQAEVIDGPFGSRKEYLNSLSSFAASLYLAVELELAAQVNITDARWWETWLDRKVNDEGEEIGE